MRFIPSQTARRIARLAQILRRTKKRPPQDDNGLALASGNWMLATENWFYATGN